MSYLEVDRVTKTYPSSRPVPVLRDVNFTADPHEVVAITGPSGCGKSTLIDILGLLTRPDNGRILLGGVDVGSSSVAERTSLRQAAISIIFQQGNLFPHLTAAENVAVGLSGARSGRRVRQALVDAGLASIADRRAGLLSGGERQRVAVARALVRGTRLLLADEPTASLDPDNANAVLTSLRSAADLGTVVVVTSHDERVTAMATQRAVLRSGELRFP